MRQWIVNKEGKRKKKGNLVSIYSNPDSQLTYVLLVRLMHLWSQTFCGHPCSQTIPSCSFFSNVYKRAFAIKCILNLTKHRKCALILGILLLICSLFRRCLLNVCELYSPIFTLTPSASLQRMSCERHCSRCYLSINN